MPKDRFMKDCTQYSGVVFHESLATTNMSHRKFWVLGIVSILLLSTVSQAHAESDDDTTEVRAGNVRITRDADGNTQIETDRVKIQSEPSRIRQSARYRNSTRHHRTIRSSVFDRSTSYSDVCFDREDTIQHTNSSSSSSNNQVNSQTTRIHGNNRTIIQSSTSR